jgi:GNAT superfamily N-acetyltransferase
MAIEILEVGPEYLPDYSRIPIRFEVRSVFDVELVDGGLGGIQFHERTVEPHVKDYDELESPEDWPRRFDLRNWGFFLARDGADLVGAAALAFNTAGVHMLEERPDLPVLWDIRVRPEVRGRGVGRALFDHAGRWARARGCTRMKAETQNINVPACRFYREMGGDLGVIHRFAYAAMPPVAGEVMLNWYFNL